MLNGDEAAKAQAALAPLGASACCEDMPPGDCCDNCDCCDVIPAHKSRNSDAITAVQSNNPKDIAGAGKCPLWLVPPFAEHVEARVLEHGAAKYGPWNWRDEKILLSNYISATRRHLAAFIDGEDVDPESGLLHLGHARATLGIILDALANDCLIDDRPKSKPV